MHGLPSHKDAIDYLADAIRADDTAKETPEVKQTSLWSQAIGAAVISPPGDATAYVPIHRTRADYHYHNDHRTPGTVKPSARLVVTTEGEILIAGDATLCDWLQDDAASWQNTIAGGVMTSELEADLQAMRVIDDPSKLIVVHSYLAATSDTLGLRLEHSNRVDRLVEHLESAEWQQRDTSADPVVEVILFDDVGKQP